jgi:hypothetical protein
MVLAKMQDIAAMGRISKRLQTHTKDAPMISKIVSGGRTGVDSAALALRTHTALLMAVSAQKEGARRAEGS